MIRKIKKELSIVKEEKHVAKTDLNDLKLISSELRAEKYFKIGFTEAADYQYSRNFIHINSNDLIFSFRMEIA